MEERIEPDLVDAQRQDNKKLANLLDPVRWSILIRDFQNTDDKRSFAEMVEELINGR